jgi:PA14 domain
MRIWIDGNIIHDTWTNRTSGDYTKNLAISAGQHDVKVEYREDTVSAIAKVSWEKAPVTPVIPTNRFRAEYFNNNSLSGPAAFTRPDDAIAVDWKASGPGNGVGNDNFSVRWTGKFNFDGGNYNFSTGVDDGMKIWIDGNLIHNTWTGRSSIDQINNVAVSAGEHEVKVEYREDGGAAMARVGWEKVKQSSDPFQDAINRVGGPSVVGTPVGGQMRWVGSTVQDFNNGGALGILMKADGTNIAYWINGDFFKEYYKYQVDVGVLGAPTSDRYAFQGGWRQNFQGGMIIQRPSGIISVEPTIEAMNSKPVFWSQTRTPVMNAPITNLLGGGISEQKLTSGGLRAIPSDLGKPISNVVTRANGNRYQFFEGGGIEVDATGAIITAVKGVSLASPANFGCDLGTGNFNNAPTVCGDTLDRDFNTKLISTNKTGNESWDNAQNAFAQHDIDMRLSGGNPTDFLNKKVTAAHRKLANNPNTPWIVSWGMGGLANTGDTVQFGYDWLASSVDPSYVSWPFFNSK